MAFFKPGSYQFTQKFSQAHPGDYGLTKGKWHINEIGLKTTKSIGEFTGIADRNEILEPGMIKVIELVPFK